MHVPHRFVAAFLVATSATLALARTAARTEDPPASRDPLDVTNYYGLVLHEPAMDHVQVTKDHVYRSEGAVRLKCDVFRPQGVATSRALPVVVFVNGVGDFGDDSLKNWRIYQDWGRAVAGRGLAGVTMSARREHVADDLAAMVAHLKSDGASLGIDGARIAIWSCSANVSVGLPFAMDPEHGASLTAAVICYGAPREITEVNRALPLLWICSGRDGIDTIVQQHAWWARAAEEGAPWTTIHAQDLPHAFDAFDPGVESKRLVRVMLDFLVAKLTEREDPDRIAKLPVGERATWFSYARDTAGAIAAFDEIVAKEPGNERARSMLGTLLLQSGDVRRALEFLGDRLESKDADPGLLGAAGMALVTSNRRAQGLKYLERASAAGLPDSRVEGLLAHEALISGDTDGGIAHYEKAFQYGIPDGANTRGVAAYNLACGYARKGRVDDAMRRLEEAAAQGFGRRAEWERDDDLASLHKDPRWAPLVARLQQ